ncbi:MAG: DUF2344 domain-containing protein [Firmicutes bacterium]|nr:DUF2344 domain-containing protein [Bacillota bacterium]
MNRYLLMFQKKGNMRFLSHLDLYRLFRRALNRADVRIAFSNGYNPHEKVNIVQPLSLGFESDAEFFEVDTITPYDCAKMMEDLNRLLPEGVRFTAAGEIEYRSKNLTGSITRSAYKAFYPLEGKAPDAEAFLSQDSVVILRRDKKSGKMVERDVKQLIYRFECSPCEGGIELDMLLSSSSNAIVNPMNLTEAFFVWAGLDYLKEEIRINRTAMFCSLNGKEENVASLIRI